MFFSAFSLSVGDWTLLLSDIELLFLSPFGMPREGRTGFSVAAGAIARVYKRTGGEGKKARGVARR